MGKFWKVRSRSGASAEFFDDSGAAELRLDGEVVYTLTSSSTGLTESQVIAAVNGSSAAPSSVESIALLGDSITYFNTNNVPNFYANGYLSWALALRSLYVGSALNYGVSGNTTADMLARVSSVIASGAKICIVMGGTNDAAQSIATATTQANLASIYQDLMDAGIYVIAMACPPRSNGATNTNLINRINKYISSYWSTRLNRGKFVDCFATTADSTSANSPWKTNYAYDSPGTHPSNLGAFYLGQPLGTVLATLLPTRQLATTNNDYIGTDSSSNNLIVNPMFTGSGGTAGAGITGTVSANWNVLGVVTNCTGVASVVSGVNGVGSALQVVWTSDATAGIGYVYTGDLKANAVVGNLLQGDICIDVSSATNLIGLDVYWADNTNHNTTVTAGVSAGSNVLPLASVTGVYVGRYLSWNSGAEIGYVTAINGNNVTMSVNVVTPLSNGATITGVNVNHWGIDGNGFPKALPSAFTITPVTPATQYNPGTGTTQLRLWVAATFGGVGGATIKYCQASLRDLGAG